MNANIGNLQWVANNEDAALPLAAAVDFCGKEATDESAKIAAVLFLDKKQTTGAAVQLLGSDSLDTVKASEMSKCMLGLGYKRKEI